MPPRSSHPIPLTETSSVVPSSEVGEIQIFSDGQVASCSSSRSEVIQFTQFYLETRSALRGYLTTLVRDHAAVEDCLQETCLVVWKKMEARYTLEDFRKVAFTCARFKALSWLKKNKPSDQLSLSHELADKLATKAAEQSIAEARGNDFHWQRQEALRHCVNQLSGSHQEIVKARYESSESDALAKVASAQNRSIEAVYKILERVRTSLRKCVEKQLRRE